MKIIRKKFTEVDNKEILEIDELIENNFGLIFHETQFNRIVSESFNTELSYFVAYNNDNKIIGICPLHTIKKGLIKLTYSNPAIFEVPYGGWIFDKKQVKIQQLLKYTNPLYNESFTYWSNIQIKEDIYKGFFGQITPHQTAIVDLSLEEDTIWKNIIHSKRRNMIRKALKSEINIKSYSAEGFELYYPLMTDMHNKSGLKSKPKAYYRDIIDIYFKKKQAVILLAEKDNEVISGIILIGNKYIMHYWQGASKKGVPNLGQGELLQWEAIKWAKQIGCKYYDLCIVETERLPHIARFKLGFSKNIVPFYHLVKKLIIFRIMNRINKWF